MDNPVVSRELILTKVLLERSQYHRLISLLSKFEVDQEYKLLFNLLSNYYKQYTEQDSIDITTLQAYFDLNYPNIKDKQLYYNIFLRLSQLDVAEVVVQDVVRQFVEKQVASEIIQKLTPILYEEGWGILPGLQEDLDRFIKLADLQLDPKQIFVNQDIGELLAKEAAGEGLKWRLACLNESLGPLLGKTLGHVFACVDTGKTTFLASEAAHMAKQLKDDEIILWCNNEEDNEKVQVRVYCAVLGLSKAHIIADYNRARYWFKEWGGERIKIVNQSSISLEDITWFLKNYNARLVLVDQGDKVTFRGQGSLPNTVERLRELYGGFRNLAKDYSTDILTAGQASATAEGHKWLSRVHMDNSKVGKPGELDYAIGIGRSGDENEQMFRYINICKNKLKDGQHGKYTVKIDTQRAIYSDL